MEIASVTGLWSSLFGQHHSINPFFILRLMASTVNLQPFVELLAIPHNSKLKCVVILVGAVFVPGVECISEVNLIAEMVLLMIKHK